ASRGGDLAGDGLRRPSPARAGVPGRPRADVADRRWFRRPAGAAGAVDRLSLFGWPAGSRAGGSPRVADGVEARRPGRAPGAAVAGEGCVRPGSVDNALSTG